MSSVRVALVQLLCGADKLRNLEAAVAAIADAAANKAQIVALPECFNSPYATDQFPVYAEEIPATKAELDATRHVSSATLSKAASDHKVFLIGGEQCINPSCKQQLP
jgi:omega-amidase